MNNIKRILILGHSGFIGSHLERYFRTVLPGMEVIGRSLPTIDLTKRGDVLNLAEQCNLETAVIMCAAIKRQFGDNLNTFSQNLNIAINVCGLLKEHPVGRFVFFSSAAVYGEDNHNMNIVENTPVHPTSYYGTAKYTSERLFSNALNQNNKSSILIVRPPLIYGPGDMGETYGPMKFIKAALNKTEITLWGDGTERRDFIFIEDITKIIYHLTFCEYEGVVNIASGESCSFKDVLDIISRFSSKELKITYQKRTKRKVDNEFINKLLLSLIGCFKFTSLEEGIKRTFEYEEKVYRNEKEKVTQ